MDALTIELYLSIFVIFVTVVIMAYIYRLFYKKIMEAPVPEDEKKSAENPSGS